MICDYNKVFKKDFKNLLFKALKEGKTRDEIKSLVLDYLKSTKKEAESRDINDVTGYLDDWSKFVNKELSKIDLPLISVTKLLELITNPDNTKLDEVWQKENTTDSLDPSIKSRQQFRKDFIETIYLGADHIKIAALNDINYNLNSALLFDRDNGTITKSERELNNNIKNYLEKLFKTLFDYLKEFYKTSVNRQNNVDYSILNESLTLYNNKGEYTGAFDQIFNISRQLFKNITIGNFKVENDIVKAFNAYLTLLHFDEFVLNTLGDVISIKDLGIRFSPNKRYKIKLKATNMFWSNQLDDDIDTSKSISNIPKLIITSTRMYDFNTGLRIPDTYISFNQFVSLLGKLKDLSWNQVLCNNIPLNGSVSARTALFDYSKISELSKEYIQSLGNQATLATLINKLSINASDAYAALFELLTCPDYKNRLANVLKLFNGEEKNVLLSLNNELYGYKEGSLNYILDQFGQIELYDYFNQILLTSDTLFSVRNCQYYLGEDDSIYLRTLLSSNVSNILRDLNDTININNSYITSRKDILHNARYDKKSGFSFTLQTPNLKSYDVRVDNLGNVTLNNKPITTIITKLTYKSFIPFVDEILGLNFENNPKYLKNFANIISLGEESIAVHNLFKLASEILHGTYATRKIYENIVNQKDATIDSIKEKIEQEAKQFYPSEYYGEPKVKFDYKTIDIIPSKLITTLEYLAEAYAITEGATSAALVNDSEGKALSTSTNSRLLSSFLQLFLDIRENINSPAHDLSIVNDSNTLIDVLTVRELKGIEAKKYILFNTREFLETGFLYDFITPIINPPSSKYSLTSLLNIAFTPSVNSDKNTVSKLLINLQHEIDKIMSLANFDIETGETKDISLSKFIADGKNIGFIMEYINKELGSYYTKLYNKISNDLINLSLSPTWKTVTNNLVLEYTPKSYAKLRKALETYNKNAVANGASLYSMRDLFDTASRETGVVVNEQLHVVFGEGGVQPNNSILSLYYRHTNNLEMMNKLTIPNLSQFLDLKNAELLTLFVKNKVSIDVVNNKLLYKYLTENGLDKWISNNSSNMILAYYKGKPIISELDLLLLQNDPEISARLWELELLLQKSSKNKVKLLKLQLIHNPHILADGLELNPLIEYWNTFSYLYSQEFILSTVGSHVNHPNKGTILNPSFIEYLEDEAARYQALHKRNVSYTASMHKFTLDNIFGIPPIYNIGVILDINDLVYNVAGDLKEVKPFDGATFVNPFVVYLENNSLGSERAGTHKKQFVHFYDDESGTGGIIKTAGFGLNNSWMRNSPFLLRMMLKMTDLPWKSEDGKPIYVDITKKEQTGNDRMFYNIYYKVPYFDTKLKKWVNHFYKVKNLLYQGEGKYLIDSIQVDNKGKELINTRKEIVEGINSNYKVWKYIFKGLDSVNFNTDDESDPNRELSYKKQAGEASIENTVKAINYCGFGKFKNQRTYYLPMKHSDVHYIPTEGAVKQGVANFNLKSLYYNDTFLNVYRIKMRLAGILLDKSHHADNSEISMMTLVISACAALGYTFNESDRLYKALAKLTYLGINPLLKPLKELVVSEEAGEAQEDFDKALTGMIIKTLSNGSKSKDGVVYSISKNLIDKYKSGQLINSADLENNPLPISDPLLFNKVLSLISSMLTSAAIKMKFSGILSVLVPSHETTKLYGGRLMGDFINFEEEIKQLQAQLLPVDISRVLIGRVYNIINKNGEIIDKIMLQAPYMTNKERSNIYGDPNLKYSDYYTLREQMSTAYKDCSFVEDIITGRNLGAYFCTFDEEVRIGKNVVTRHYNFYDLKDTYNLFHKDSNTNRNMLLNTLKNLKNGGKVTVFVDGKERTITVKNLQILPYEVIMPKTMKELLGLTDEDNVNDLLNDPNSFRRKFVKNIADKVGNSAAYTLSLKRLNGDHLYILDSSQFKESLNLVEAAYLYETDPTDGKIYITDYDGNRILEVTSTKDKLYSIDGLKIIVTDNIKFYIDNANYNIMTVSEEVPSSVFNDIILYRSSNRGFRLWKDYVSMEDLAAARLRNALLISPTLDKKGNSDIMVINQLGDELYQSFKKTLDIVAARIPAQSMQSFMPMKVVGYEDFDINTAYVSTHLIWLQGSDYDIDCVSLLTFLLGKDGKFVGWSPYFRLDNDLDFLTSLEFEYPTGERVNKVLIKDLFKEVKSKEDADAALNDYIFNLFSAFTVVQNKDNILLRIADFNRFVLTINRVSTQGLLDISNEGLKNKVIEAYNNVFSQKIDILLIDNLFNALEAYVDDHNLYLDSNNAGAFTKNYIVEQIFRIAKNPVNLILAQTSVDQTTGEPKKLADEFSEAGKALKYATPGNIANLYLSIEDNHVGKDVIGISAVGLKSFFAITLYVNHVLNNGSEEEINSLLSRPLTFAGLQYYTVANANYKGENLDILNKLSNSNATDAALSLSALLSLATDNAKELCLAKLNADSNMANMYIYGLTMGIPIRPLGQLLMSDIGNVVLSYLKGSLISDKLGLSNTGKVIEFLLNPISKIQLVYRGERLWQFDTGKLGKESVWKALDSKFRSITKHIAEETEKYLGKTSKLTADMLKSTIKDPITLESYLKDLDDGQEMEIALNVLASWVHSSVKLNDMLMRLAIRDLIDVAKAKDKIKLVETSLWSGAFEDFNKLYQGAEELKVIGLLAGANLGIKNQVEDFLRFIENFENVIVNRSKFVDLKIDDPEIDFLLYMTDEAYRNQKIKIYDSIAFSFNPLRIMTVPHYLGYLQSIYTKHGTLLLKSIKYRTLYKYLNLVNSVGSSLLKKKIKSLSNLIDYQLINDYFGITGKKFYVPTNSKIIQVNLNSTSETIAKEPTLVMLGTLGGNATFKNWMELIVIPLLKLGITGASSTRNTALINNSFILSLRPNIYSRNPNKNSSISMTTSINMSPRTDEDKLLLERLRRSFDELNVGYKMSTSDGLIVNIPVKDLFYFYNLISYMNKPGKSTLTSIFDNYITSLEPSNFRRILYLLDNSGNTLDFDNKTIINWMALIESPYSSFSSYVYYKDSNLLSVELLQRATADDYSDLDSYIIGGFVYDNRLRKFNKNLVLHNPSEPDIQDITLLGLGDITYKLSYDPVLLKISAIDDSIDPEIVKKINNQIDGYTMYDPNTGKYILREAFIINTIEQKDCP